MISPLSGKKIILSAMLLLFVFGVTYSSSATELVQLTAIGKIESLYKDRVSMQILQIVSTSTSSIATGSWVSFDLPKPSGKRSRRRRRQRIEFGNVVKAELVGNVMTEYEISTDNMSAKEGSAGPVLLWTAQTVNRVKNPNDYLPENEQKKNKRSRRRKKEKEKPPVKVWTQEETIRGKIVLNKKQKRVYIKEKRMGRKTKGLDVISDMWYEKLKDLEGHKIVVHGVTHRTSISSGTVEIQNLMKIYPK